MGNAGTKIETNTKTRTNTWQYQSKNFDFDANVDHRSKRLWVIRSRYRDITELQYYLYGCSVKLGLEKIILPVMEGEEKNYRLFKPEGRIQKYFNGMDAVFLAGYTKPRRGLSPELGAEKEILAEVMKKEYKKVYPPEGYEIRIASPDDAREMTKVFSRVFETYPSPVFKTEYLADRMNAGDKFWLALHHRKIVAVSSVEIDSHNSRAEFTDFATLPEYRGLGLASVLLGKMREECRAMGIVCLFSLARASSFGMNSVFYRQGYVYGGTLVNNCHICGRYEDMNIWYLQP